MVRNSPTQSRMMDSVTEVAASAGTTCVFVVAHQLFAEAVALRLKAEVDLEIAGWACSAATAVREAERARADVAIVESCLPDGDGLGVAADIGATNLDTRVLYLAPRREEGMVVAAVAAGCSGFLTNDAETAELLLAIRQLGIGESYIPARLLSHLVPRLTVNSHVLGRDLSSREREVLDLLSTGAPTQRIADQLFVSVTTVRNHVQRILLKLGAHSKLEAVVVAVREGIIAQPH